MDSRNPQYRAVVTANQAIAQCDATIASAQERRAQWHDYRVAAWNALTSQVPAAPAETTPAPASAPPTPEPVVPTAVSSRLTPPVLLGVGGAALLVASAMVFVAVSWQALHPLAQSGVMIALAVGVGALAVWLLRLGATVTSGAVGVVAMAFPAVAVVALDRAGAGLGDFVGPVALLVACATAAPLRRLGVPWVEHVSSALLVLVGLWTTAATYDSGAIGAVLAPVVAAVASVLIALTHGTWRARWDRRAVRLGAVAVAAFGVVQVWGAQTVAGADAGWALLAGLAPIAVLGALGRVWVRPAWWALGLVVPVWFLGAAGVLGIDGGMERAAVVGVGAVVLALVTLRLPVVMQRPAWTTGAVWILVPVGVLFATLAQWATDAIHEDPYSPVNPWSGLMLLIFAAAVFAVVRAVPERVVSAVSVAGASLALGGVLLAAWGGTAQAIDAVAVAPVASAIPSLYAVTTVLAAWVIAAAMMAWRDTRAQWVLGVAAVVATTIAGLVGVMHIGSAQPGPAIAAAVLACASLAAGLTLHAPTVLGPLSLLASVVAGVVMNEGLVDPAAGVAAAGVVAAFVVIVAILVARPVAELRSAAVGAAPAFVLALALALVAVPVVPFAVTSGINVLSVVGASDAVLLWGGVALASVAAVVRALLDVPRLRPRRGEVDLIATVLWALVPAPLAGGAAVIWADSPRWVVLSVVVACAMASWGSVLLALSRAARSAGWLIGTVAVTLAAVVTLLDTAQGDVLWFAGLAIAVAALAAVAGAALVRPRFAVGPLVFLVTMAVATVAVVAGAASHEVVVSVSIAAAALAWSRLLAPPEWRVPALVGLVPAAAYMVSALSDAAAQVALRVLVQDIQLQWAAAAIAVLLVLGVASIRGAREMLAVLMAVALIVVSACLPLPTAWALPLLTGVAVVVGLTISQHEGHAFAKRVRYKRASALAVSASAVVWALDDPWVWTVTLATTGALALVIAYTRRSGAGQALLGMGALALGGSAVVACRALEQPWEAAALLLAVMSASVVVMPVAQRIDPRRTVAVVMLVLLSVAAPVVSGSIWGAGLVFVALAGAWWALRVTGLAWGTWAALGSLVVGNALLLAFFNVRVVEAYVVLPATIMLVMGVAHLVRNPGASSLAALWPGLTVALVPSFVALAYEPDHVARAVWLCVAAVVLAVVGVMRRWMAPVGAAAITAVVVALSQVSATESLVPRWLAFAAVGAILILLAATYEKLKRLA